MLARVTNTHSRPQGVCTCWPSQAPQFTARQIPRVHSSGSHSRNSLKVCRASDQDKQSASPAVSDADLDEQRIEALEASTKRAQRSSATRRQIPIKGMTKPQQQQSGSGNRAAWKKGQLLPEGKHVERYVVPFSGWEDGGSPVPRWWEPPPAPTRVVLDPAASPPPMCDGSGAGFGF